MEIVFEVSICDEMEDEEYNKMIKCKEVFDNVDRYIETIKKRLEQSGFKTKKINLTK